MTDSADKPSLKDIADQDAKKDSAERPAAAANGAGRSGAPLADAQAAEAPVADAQVGAQVAAQAKKSGGGLVWFVVLLLVLGGGGAAGWSVIGPRVEPVIADMRALLGMTPRPTQARLPSDTPPIVAEMPAETPVEPPVESSAESLADAPADVLAEPPMAEPAPEDAAEVAPEIVLETLPASMPQAPESSVDATQQQLLDSAAELTRALAEMKSELAEMAARLQALEDGSRADPTAPAQALVLGVTQLRSRLTGDSPFAAELAALETIAAGDATVSAALQRLRPHAEVGVPSEAALTARFNKVALAILGARSSAEAGGWLGAVKESLGGLVTVRRTDPAAITDQVERAVAVAEAALELGELDEAVQALSEVQGAPGEAAAAWLGDAQARLDAEAALEALHSHALAALSAAGGA